MNGSVMVHLKFLLKYIFNCVLSMQKYINALHPAYTHSFQIKYNRSTLVCFRRYKTGWKSTNCNTFLFLISLMFFLAEMSEDAFFTFRQTFGNVFKPVVFKVYVATIRNFRSIYKCLQP